MALGAAGINLQLLYVRFRFESNPEKSFIYHRKASPLDWYFVFVNNLLPPTLVKEFSFKYGNSYTRDMPVSVLISSRGDAVVFFNSWLNEIVWGFQNWFKNNICYVVWDRTQFRTNECLIYSEKSTKPLRTNPKSKGFPEGAGYWLRSLWAVVVWGLSSLLGRFKVKSKVSPSGDQIIRWKATEEEQSEGDNKKKILTCTLLEELGIYIQITWTCSSAQTAAFL